MIGLEWYIGLVFSDRVGMVFRVSVHRILVGSFPQVKEGRNKNILFNDALNTFYLRLYGIRHMVKDHSDSERGNLLLPHGLLFPISSNGYFICTSP